MTQWLNELGKVWVQHIAQMTIQDSLFILLVFAVLFALRRKDVRLRRLVAILGLGKLVLPSLPAGFGGERPFAGPVEQILISVSGASRIGESAGLGWQAALMIAWLAGVVIIMAAVLGRTNSLLREVDSYPLVAPGALPPEALNKKIRFVVSDRSESPFTVGVWKPRIVLPRNWESWSGEKRRAVIAHELTHVSQWDSWVRLLQLTVEALFFFNPIVWLMSRRITVLSEMACDQAAVTSLGCSPISYSKVLIDIVSGSEKSRTAPMGVSLGLSSYGMIKERVLHLLDNLESGAPVARGLALGVVAMLVLAGAALSVDYAQAKSQVLASTRVRSSGDTRALGYHPPRPVDGLQAIQDRLTTCSPEIVLGARSGEDDLVIQLSLDENGTVRKSSWLQAGCQGSARAVSKALDGLQWEPARFNGKAASSEVVLTFIR